MLSPSGPFKVVEMGHKHVVLYICNVYHKSYYCITYLVKFPRCKPFGCGIQLWITVARVYTSLPLLHLYKVLISQPMSCSLRKNL